MLKKREEKCKKLKMPLISNNSILCGSFKIFEKLHKHFRRNI
jgi:hypothetical protein